jgi:hypothetical protein
MKVTGQAIAVLDAILFGTAFVSDAGAQCGSWMRRHPGSEIVSRDRASLYAEAATKAAPQAVQIADRWHLLHNLSEALIDALRPHHRLLAEVAKTTSGQPEEDAVPNTLQSNAANPRTRRQKIRQQENRERRLACYEAVMEQLRQGVTQVDIARRCSLGVRTIRHWIRAHGFPERQSTPPHHEGRSPLRISAPALARGLSQRQPTLA